MDYKKEIVKVLDALKLKGYDRSEIEKTLGYSENWIDQVLARGGNKKAFNVLKAHNNLVLPKATLNQVNEKTSGLQIPGVRLIEGMADLKDFEKKNKINSGDNSLTMMALVNMTESNRIMAESNKTLAESNRTLVNNNQDLIGMLKKGKAV